MRAFILFVCLASAVVARPDVGIGYNYNNLQQLQNPLSLPQNGQLVSPQAQQQLPVEQTFLNFAPQMTYGAPSPPLPVPNSIEQAPTALLPEEPTALAQPAPILGDIPQDSYNMAYQQSSLPHASGYPYAPAQTKVHKHIYVHVPPKDFDEEDVVEPRVHHQVGPKQKHYKIVFIKAPSAPAIRAPVVAPPPQNEEKTLIYVLHKKPEEAQDIVIPTPAPTKPSKPEVYFIKYKTKKAEAPVYGPPPAVEVDPRSADAPNAEYAAPVADDFASVSPVDLAAPAPITTIQPAQEEQAAPQFSSALPIAPTELYSAPTMGAIRVADTEPTIAAPSAPTINNQYLAPEATQPTVKAAEESNHVPAANYGPPGRFFIKKKK